MEKFIHHIAGDDALRGVHEVDVLADFEAEGFNLRAYIAVDGAGADGGFDYDGCALRAYLEHVFHSCHDVAGVYFLGEFVVRGGH